MLSQSENKFPLIDDDVKQVVLGSLLGRSYIATGGTNDYLCMKDNIKNAAWLRTKAKAMVSLTTKKPFYEHDNKLSWRTACLPFFTELKKEIYRDDHKCVTMAWLDQLRDLAIAVWFGDSGTMTGRDKKNASLRTTGYGKEGNEIIENYFNKVGIPCAANKSRTSYNIVFSVEGTETLVKLIANSIPDPKLLKLMPF